MKIKKVLGIVASVLVLLILAGGVSLFFWGDKIIPRLVQWADRGSQGSSVQEGFSAPKSTQGTEAAPTFDASAKGTKAEKSADLKWPSESAVAAEIKIDVPQVPDEIKEPASGGK